MPQPLFTPQTQLPSTGMLRHHRAHACLGSYVLIHLLYRYSSLFIHRTSDMGFDERFISPLLLLPHMLLQVSGFGFKISRKRHPEGNRIWPEYRWHALVFFLRCLSLLILAWYRKRHSRFDYMWLNAMVVFATMIGADTVTTYFRRIGESSPTIRGLTAPDGVLYLMSAAQFHATVHCFLTSDRMSVQLAALTVVQTTSFGMTLRRKGKINLPEGLVLYSFVLALGMLTIWDDLAKTGMFFKATTIGNVAALTRMNLRLNKYVLWATVTWFLLSRNNDAIHSNNWITLSRLSTLLLVGSALYRQLKAHARLSKPK